MMTIRDVLIGEQDEVLVPAAAVVEETGERLAGLVDREVLLGRLGGLADAPFPLSEGLFNGLIAESDDAWKRIWTALRAEGRI